MMDNIKKYKLQSISSRRYLGNKFKLLGFICDVVKSECGEFETFADIFAGTGSVSFGFRDKVITTNDIMYSNYICNLAWFGSQMCDLDKIAKYIVDFNSIVKDEQNYMTDNFADTYFCYSDCSKIGIIREKIEYEYLDGNLNERERAILISSLIYAMDKIAQTCGHYDAYRRCADFSSHIELTMPNVTNTNNVFNRCFNMDSNELVKMIEADVVYIDPPYNSRQYCDAYHLLENVATWKKPSVSGVAKKMNRDGLKSKYCTISATETFKDLISNIHARYIVLSYNNMCDKGNSRSNAKMTDEDILKILCEKGTTKTFSESHKAFTAGKSDIAGNEERLFVCSVGV